MYYALREFGDTRNAQQPPSKAVDMRQSLQPKKETTCVTNDKITGEVLHTPTEAKPMPPCATDNRYKSVLGSYFVPGLLSTPSLPAFQNETIGLCLHVLEAGHLYFDFRKVGS